MFVLPDPLDITEGDVVAIGGKLSTENLFDAYSKGIFPWPQKGLPMLWFCPQQRGVLDFKDLTISKSLRRALKKPWVVTYNKAFNKVINECARQFRPGQDGTWISNQMIQAYTAFHHQGYAFSVECWLDQELVGGLYGVSVNGFFAGESMFYKVNDASKVALISLVKTLEAQGVEFLDIQMVTPHLEKLGAKYISKTQFLERLQGGAKPPKMRESTKLN